MTNEIRLDEKKRLDDIVLEATHVHIEQMSKSSWLVIVSKGSERVHLMFTSKSRVKATLVENQYATVVVSVVSASVPERTE